MVAFPAPLGITGVLVPPQLYTAHIVRTAKIVLILWFVQPLLLAMPFTGMLTIRHRAEFLASFGARMGVKKGIAI
jgi:hypothetical protein